MILNFTDTQKIALLNFTETQKFIFTNFPNSNIIAIFVVINSYIRELWRKKFLNVRYTPIW